MRYFRVCSCFLTLFCVTSRLASITFWVFAMTVISYNNNSFHFPFGLSELIFAHAKKLSNKKLLPPIKRCISRTLTSLQDFVSDCLALQLQRKRRGIAETLSSDSEKLRRWMLLKYKMPRLNTKIINENSQLVSTNFRFLSFKAKSSR